MRGWDVAHKAVGRTGSQVQSGKSLEKFKQGEVGSQREQQDHTSQLSETEIGDKS